MSQILDLENSSPFTFVPGNLPILVSFPHNSSIIPTQLSQQMTTAGRSSRDTDWFLDRLYDLPELRGASKLVAGFSRYVIDLNRPANNQSLYPGQTTTGLIPETCFDGAVIYTMTTPTDSNIAARVKQVWCPYHAQLEAELERLRQRHGFAVLIEAHSIKSQVPRLFEGILPDFNIGTNGGASCDSGLEDTISSVLLAQEDYSHVVNGRFIGGYITRQYGVPASGVHAVQFELSQSTYLDEETAQWDDAAATKVQSVFSQIMKAISQWKPSPVNQ